VVKIGRKWMLYLTCYNSDRDCGIFAFSSDAPDGPFDFVSKITHSKDTGIKDTIDPEVVRDGTQLWLFFGSVGRVHRIKLDKTGTAPAEGAEYELVAGMDIDTDPSRQTVFEGSYLHRHGSWWYLFVSSGHFGDGSYRIRVGRSSSLDGVFLDKSGSKMSEGYGTVILSSVSGDRFYGPGHNGEIFTDKTGQDYILYHCHDASSTVSGSRSTLLQRIYWDEDGWPFFKTGKPLAIDESPIF
jgi:beta-xylosidase